MLTLLLLALSEYRNWSEKFNKSELYYTFKTNENQLHLTPLREDQLIITADIVSGKLRPFRCVPIDPGENTTKEISAENNLLFPYYELLEGQQDQLEIYSRLMDQRESDLLILSKSSGQISHSVPFGVSSRYLVDGTERTDFSIYKMNFEYPLAINYAENIQKIAKPINTSRAKATFGEVRFMKRPVGTFSSCSEQTEYIENIDFKSRQRFKKKLKFAVESTEVLETELSRLARKNK